MSLCASNYDFGISGPWMVGTIPPGDHNFFDDINWTKPEMCFWGPVQYWTAASLAKGGNSANLDKSEWTGKMAAQSYDTRKAVLTCRIGPSFRHWPATTYLMPPMLGCASDGRAIRQTRTSGAFAMTGRPKNRRSRALFCAAPIASIRSSA